MTRLRSAPFAEMASVDPVGKLSSESAYDQSKHKNWLRVQLRSWIDCARCSDCGITLADFPGVMDIIHARGKRGDRTPYRMATKGMGIGKIRAEFEKYDVVCPTCKRKMETRQGTLGRIMRGDGRNGRGRRGRADKGHAGPKKKEGPSGT